MSEQEVLRDDLEDGIPVPTGEHHKFVLTLRSASRLEVEDTLFSTGSAVVLPELPGGGAGGEAQDIDFSNEALWSELRASHDQFARDVREQPYTPEEDGGGGLGSPAAAGPGLEVILAALTFASEHAEHKLLAAGHADRSGPPAFNLSLSDARACAVIALLEGDRAAWVKACHQFNAPEDDAIILRWAAARRGWPCHPGDGTKATPEAIRAFQKSYNEAFDASITVDGDVGDQTRGAYFDLYEEDLGEKAGGPAELAAMRDKVRYLDAGKKHLAFGEQYPIENPAQDGYRSQRNRRVELLFFALAGAPPSASPDLGDRLYKQKAFKIDVLDRRAVLRETQGAREQGGEPPPVGLKDAEPPEAGVSEPEDALETAMVAAGEHDPEDPWAFLEPFDARLPADGRQSGRPLPPDSTVVA